MSCFVSFAFPALLRAQGLAQLALSTLPVDTHQLTYTDLSQLRNSPDYPAIRSQLLGGGVRSLADALRASGDDPEKDADEVVLAWRGASTAPTGFFGLASGHFHPDQIRAFFKRRGLSTEYDGFRLYVSGSGSGEARSELYFTFLDDSSAAFGRLSDLKALLDVRAGLSPALDTNSSFVDWETELDGAAPLWGISTGRAAASQAAMWMTGTVKPPADLGALMAPVQAVLYTVDLGSSLSTHISVICDRPETASALSQLVLMWRNAQAASTNSSAELGTFLAGLDISANGPRVDLNGSGPLSLIQQLGH